MRNPAFESATRWYLPSGYIPVPPPSREYMIGWAFGMWCRTWFLERIVSESP